LILLRVSIHLVTQPDIRDKKDLPVLVSAILKKVDILITGDKEFFEVISEKPEIISPRGFITSY